MVIWIFGAIFFQLTLSLNENIAVVKFYLVCSFRGDFLCDTGQALHCFHHSAGRRREVRERGVSACLRQDHQLRDLKDIVISLAHQ